MAPPQYILGASQFGGSWTETQITSLKAALKSAQINRVDSAALYPINAPGTSERLLGSAGYVEEGIKIDTKVLWVGDGKGHLTAEAIERSLTASLERLGADKVNVLYIQGPDKTTPIAEQAAAMDVQYKKGRFDYLGVCNIDLEMLQEWLRIADEHSYVKPSFYQGQYNLISRTYEANLFPLLKKHNIAFAAFSPLAGGVLTGKLTFSKGNDDLQGTRFEVAEGNLQGMFYRYWYDKPSIHDAVRKLASACEPHGISVADAALRWLLFHSPLATWDGCAVIIGPNGPNQLEDYVASRSRGELPAGVADEIDALWGLVKDDAAAIVVY